jgi:hypothetical protein
MAGSRKVVSFFLASPGDLAAERKVAKQIADELNSMLSQQLNVHIELVGWEETVSTAGRPKEIINRDLERCDVFIGMIWKRWGSAPDNESKYQSGFEEEFAIATAGNTQKKKPLISMFFKQVEAAALNDPGEQLQKVMQFRKKIVEEKKLLFKDFETTVDFENLIRKCIVKYVFDHLENSESQLQATHTPDSGVQAPQSEQAANSYDFSPIRGHSANFIQAILGRTGDAQTRATLKPFEVARLRLISNGLGQSQNDSAYLGTHDANLIYRNKDQCTFETQEILSLLHTGAKNSTYENVPLWYWLQHPKNEQYNLSFLTLTITESDHSIIKSILDLMTIGEIPLQTDALLTRDSYFGYWLTNDNASVKNSALRYLSHMGIQEDLTHIRSEIELNSSQTIAMAQEAFISIELRHGVGAGFKALRELQPASLSAEIVEQLFANAAHITTSELFQAAENRNKLVRRKSIETLLKRVSLPDEFIDSIRQDSEPSVRALAIPALLNKGIKLNANEAKAIVVKDASKPTSDEDGAWSKYQPSLLSLVDIDELRRRSSRDLPLKSDSYIELCRRDLNAKRAELTANLADRYEQFYSQHMQVWAESRGDDAKALIEEFGNLKSYIVNIFIRSSINLLVDKKSIKDIAIIRSALADPTVKATISDFVYLSRHGEWQDIPLITSLTERFNNTGGKTLLTGIEAPVEAVALAVKAILKLGKNRLVDTLKLKHPKHLSKYIISSVKDSDFLKLDNALIFEMLHDEDTEIRKHCAMKCAKTYSKSRLAELLDRYNQSKHTYYNVVHWLDFGLYAPKDTVKIICGKTFLKLT